MKLLTGSSSVETIRKYLDTAFPIFFFLMAAAFYLRTYDSAMIKITELQVFGSVLVAFFLCKIFESGHWPLRRNQTMMVLPFLLFLVSGIISFIRSPLPMGSLDFFVRRLIYIGIALIAVTEMTSKEDFRRITKWLVITTVVVAVYGLIQYIDVNYFPPGPPSVGLDKFVWRGAFGPRVFSTFGNPNFFSNFLVIMIPVMLAMYLRTRQFFYLPLIALSLCNIYWTGSKGPAAGLIGGISVFSFLIIRFFVQSRKFKIIVFSTALVLISILAGYIINRVFFQGSITSFTFRAYTWLSTWEMVNSRPILGNGIGTFWVVYPGYRRPAIFHIEGKHNTETDHAENEHLEVWQDEGIVGMGLWIWLILTLTIGLYKALAILTTQPTRGSPLSFREYPEEVYYILGFLSGFLGMLIHNNTDVSMRFVSSGTPFWLLAGLNAALVMYSPLPEKQEEVIRTDNDSIPEWILRITKIAKVVTFIVIGLVAIRVLRLFDWAQGRDGMLNPNESLHFYLSWGVFLLCWGYCVKAFGDILLKARKLKSVVVLFVISLLIVPAWGEFMGDVHHNRAIFFSKQGVWMRGPEFDAQVQGFPREYQVMYRGGSVGFFDPETSVGKFFSKIFPDILWRAYGLGGALEHYASVCDLRPDFIMARYFRGNVFNDWGSSFASRAQDYFNRGNIAEGEIYRQKADELWQKALDSYAETRHLSPDYVQVLHQIGTVHQKWGEFLKGLSPLATHFGRTALANELNTKAVEHWTEALNFYKLYYKIDPVYDQNYYRMAQIYSHFGDIDRAEQIYIDHIQGKECKNPKHQIFGGIYYPEVNLGSGKYDLSSTYHQHDTAQVIHSECWAVLGDFYQYARNNIYKAQYCYEQVVEQIPTNINFLKRLAMIYGQQNKVAEMIEVWKKVYALNPQDPDVQRVFNRR